MTGVSREVTPVVESSLDSMAAAHSPDAGQHCDLLDPKKRPRWALFFELVGAEALLGPKSTEMQS